jgi:hypothetical protein
MRLQKSKVQFLQPIQSSTEHVRTFVLSRLGGFCQFVGFASHHLVSCQPSQNQHVCNSTPALTQGTSCQFCCRITVARETSSEAKRVELILQRN